MKRFFIITILTILITPFVNAQDIKLNGTVSAESNQIKNAADPTSAQDVATKNYVDNAGIQGPAGADGAPGPAGADGADATVTAGTGIVVLGGEVSLSAGLNDLTDARTSNQSFFIGSDLPVGQGSGAYYNVALGTKAMNSVSNGDYNTAIGQEALEKLTTSHKNTAIGAQALRYVENGANNTAIGAYAGDELTGGSNNVVIGHNAGTQTAQSSNQIVIGKGAHGQADDSVTLGNADIDAVFMAEDSGASVYAAKYYTVDSNGVATELTSSTTVAKFGWESNYFNITSNVENFVPWDTEKFNSSQNSEISLVSSGSTTNAAIKVSSAGYYEVKTSTRFYDLTAGRYLDIKIAKKSNDSASWANTDVVEVLFSHVYQTDNNKDKVSSGSTILYLDANDMITIGVVSNHSLYPANLGGPQGPKGAILTIKKL